MTAWYNENDPYAAQWLRNLIAAGHIAPGVVDERSIEDVRPADLRGYTQCHFFAGIGVWSLALRRAGWPDDRPIWTGSCPCQPFSAAGKSDGFADERHLWPAWYWLVRECRPGVLAGEQVASKAAGVWLDAVQADLETLGYAFGALAFPSAGVGAPHIRDRTFWVADASGPGFQKRVGDGRVQREEVESYPRKAFVGYGNAGGMGDAGSEPRQWDARGIRGKKAESGGPRRSDGNLGYRHSDAGDVDRLADAERHGHEGPESSRQATSGGRRPADEGVAPGDGPTGPTNGFWRDADWLFCRDGKWRPVEPGTFPLAHGAAARVGRLRAYGNAINAEAATVFLEAYLDVEAERAGRADLNEDLDELI